jgi:hypothetical protein
MPPKKDKKKKAQQQEAAELSPLREQDSGSAQ